MDIAIGDLLITDDETQWRIYSITRTRSQRFVVALHPSSPTILTVEAARLVWSETDCAWRIKEPSASGGEGG